MRIIRQPDILLHEGDSKERIKEAIEKWENKSKDNRRDYFLLNVVDEKGTVINSAYGARYLFDEQRSSYDLDRRCYFRDEFVDELYSRSRKTKTVTVSVEQVQTYTTTIRVPEEYSDKDINEYILDHPDFKKGVTPLEQLNVHIADNDLTRYSNQLDDDYEDCIGL